MRLPSLKKSAPDFRDAEWISVEDLLPEKPYVCVVLTPLGLSLLDRRLAQYMDGFWYYTGSDQRLRDVLYWVPLPKLPKL